MASAHRDGPKLGSEIKRFVTVDRDIADEVLRKVGKRGFSRFVNEAIRARLQADRVRAVLTAMDEDVGCVSPRIENEVRKKWTARSR